MATQARSKGGRPKKREIVIPDSVLSLKPVKIVKGIKIYEDNPFVTTNNFSIQIRDKSLIVAGELEIRDKKDGEVSAGLIGRIQEVDEERFVKLYASGVSSLFELSTTAQKALQAVICAIQDTSVNVAHVFINYYDACKYYKDILNFPEDKIPVERGFVYGMNELVKMKFLARHARGSGWYWFNPSLLFNGDRVTFVTQYVRKRKLEKDDPRMLKLPMQ
jgi:hypothetical protein